MPTLFDPLKLGALSLPNRIIMAPLTRSRATPDGRVPTDLQARILSSSAPSAGLIISEATSVSPMGVGYAATPGHLVGRADRRLEEGHQGRACRRRADGAAALACGPRFPSAVPERRVAGSAQRRAAQGPCLAGAARNGICHAARAGARSEIPGIIAAFRHGAENAKAAGFDGVHIHGANGYLLDQFLQDSTNQRDDDYGGAIENRARLMLEVTDACIDVWGADRVGMHLAPRMDSHDMGDSDRLGTFTYVARELGKRKLGWIAAREAVIGADTKLVDSQGRPKPINNAESIGPALKEAFGGAYIANEGFDLDSAQKALAEGWADAVAFGKLFIANPDLPQAIRQKARR